MLVCVCVLNCLPSANNELYSVCQKSACRVDCLNVDTSACHGSNCLRDCKQNAANESAWLSSSSVSSWARYVKAGGPRCPKLVLLLRSNLCDIQPPKFTQGCPEAHNLIAPLEENIRKPLVQIGLLGFLKKRLLKSLTPHLEEYHW